jgi:hypothetical protein
MAAENKKEGDHASNSSDPNEEDESKSASIKSVYKMMISRKMLYVLP